ncbi:hypothetical protein DVDV_2165 [Desulfovibrio sp. DV]|uniref:hypothetical protein n=1 Tax=Desulfovibrio sp. DV TaxID=1844708 RepID=UPI00094B95D1|nr:hypothetical protein [Desulfovibrio sp. DV]OLN27367.1 hypothetical protein DVDV_2165 [Desulfovibrio sp. DV]
MSFLGRFLVEQGAITEAQLEDGLRLQREKNRRIGEVAVERGVLSPDQVDVIRGRQDDDPRLFGDIAVGEHHLSRRSLDDLLFIQKIQHTYLGEALLLLGHIDRPRYQELMGRHYALRDKSRVSLRYLQEYFADNRVAECLFAAVTRAVHRTTGEEAAITGFGSASPPSAYPENAVIEGTILGGRRYAAGLGLSRPLAARLADSAGAADGRTGLAVFYDRVLRYFGDMLRDVSLLLESGRVVAGTLPGEGCGDCLAIRIRTPSGELGLTFWLEEVAA